MATNLQTLDYATPGADFDWPALLDLKLGISAVVGLFVNFSLIYLGIDGQYRTAWVYHDLMQNSRAFGREIDPATIASLRNSYLLQTWEVVSDVAAAFGMLLALHLLVAVIRMDRNPEACIRRLRQYRLWKPIGVVLTMSAFWWEGRLSFDYWVAATRHITIGSTDPIPQILWNAAFLFCALLPWWWARERRAPDMPNNPQ